MTTCYEYIRKKNDEDHKMFNRLTNYFKAIEDDKINEYHDKRNRKEDKKLDEY
jgi:hypothetical protein